MKSLLRVNVFCLLQDTFCCDFVHFCFVSLASQCVFKMVWQIASLFSLHDKLVYLPRINGFVPLFLSLLSHLIQISLIFSEVPKSFKFFIRRAAECAACALSKPHYHDAISRLFSCFCKSMTCIVTYRCQPGTYMLIYCRCQCFRLSFCSLCLWHDKAATIVWYVQFAITTQ